MLQGSLDDFALDEMLGLLASTGKTGKLEVKGDRGSGSIRLHQGRLVDAGTSNTANGVEPDDVLFELLRFSDGNFHFSASDIEEGAFSTDVDEMLSSAERRLADWRTIEAVVPTLRHMVSPVADLPTDEVTLNRRDWSVLILIGGGCPVSTVCDELDLGEVEGSRQIKALTERGLIAIGAPKSSGLRRSGMDSVRVAASSAAQAAGPSGATPSADAPHESGAALSVVTSDDALPPAPNGEAGVASPPPAPPAARLVEAGLGDLGELTSEALAGEPARPQPPHPESTPDAPALADGEAPVTPNGREPIDAGTSQRSGGLLMRYLKHED